LLGSGRSLTTSKRLAIQLVADENSRLACKALFSPKKAFSAERQPDGSIRLIELVEKEGRVPSPGVPISSIMRNAEGPVEGFDIRRGTRHNRTTAHYEPYSAPKSVPSVAKLTLPLPTARRARDRAGELDTDPAVSGFLLPGLPVQWSGRGHRLFGRLRSLRRSGPLRRKRPRGCRP